MAVLLPLRLPELLKKCFVPVDNLLQLEGSGLCLIFWALQWFASPRPTNALPGLFCKYEANCNLCLIVFTFKFSANEKYCCLHVPS